MLKRRVAEGIAEHGYVLRAAYQTSGHGQGENTWESAAGSNLLLSINLNTSHIRADEQANCNFAMSLALYDLVNSYLPGQARIKWPNDIYVNNKKIAGILIENNIRENSIQSAIFGIGINVNQVLFKTPNAISLAFITKKQYDLMNCIERLCGYIEARYLQLKAESYDTIDADYLSYLYKLNDWAIYKNNEEIFEGKIIGVSTSGKLQVKRRSEKVSEFDFKEIAFL
jgi:BirA family biotin operon repressor/biotin-[acetyl-CoA-carboxylase] ligase